MRISGRDQLRQTVVRRHRGRHTSEPDISNALGAAGLVCCVVGHVTNEHIGIAMFVVVTLVVLAGLMPLRPR